MAQKEKHAPSELSAENYTMYSAFATKERAAAREEKRLKTQQQRGAMREYHATYTVRRRVPQKPQHSDAATVGGTGEAIFKRPPSSQSTARRNAVLTPSAPSKGANGRYIEIYTEEKRLQPVRLPTFRVITKANPEKKPFPTTLVIGAVISTVLLLFFIYNFVVLSEYTKSVSSLNAALTKLKQQQSSLELQLVQRDDLTAIESYVSDRLGMIKGEAMQKRYVTTVSGDKTIVVSKDNQKKIPRQSVILE